MGEDVQPDAKLTRRWHQFISRALFLLVTLFAIAGSWYAYEMQKAAKRRAAIAEIERLGGYVLYYDPSATSSLGKPPRWYSWLRRLHADVNLGNVTIVDFGGAFQPVEHVTDANLLHLRALTETELLDLVGTSITDDGLVHLRGLASLKHLDLGGTQITDAGLANIRGLTNLKSLSLASTQVTDTGLANLRGLTNLTVLVLFDTQVTDAGVKRIQKALPNCKVLAAPARERTDQAIDPTGMPVGP